MKINFFHQNQQRLLRALANVLGLLALMLVLYLVILPFYPVAQYRLAVYENKNISQEAKDITEVKAKTEEFTKSLPQSDYAISPNRLIITKIGVNAPIVDSKSEDFGLNKGVWHLPDTSSPDQGGNTVISGHRFKYLPPNNMTFYLLDKLEIGDIVSVIWKKQNYYYRVSETKVVPATELSILNHSDKPIITLFTCTPIYSTEKRLVVVGELVEDKK